MAQQVKKPPEMQVIQVQFWVRKIPWRRKWQLTPVFLPEKSHGQGSLVGYSPKGCKELDTLNAHTHTHTHQELVNLLGQTDVVLRLI